MTRTRIRPLLVVFIVALLTALVSACGDGADTKPAPGTPENPLVAQSPEPARSTGGTSSGSGSQPRSQAGHEKATQGEKQGAKRKKVQPVAGGEPAQQGSTPPPPGYKALLKNQTSHPKDRFTPCSLVTEVEAQTIVGAPLQAPLEAPLGPTCIYRTRTGKGMIAVAVQSARFSEIKNRIRSPRRIDISGREAYCGKLGQPMLYLPVAQNRVLAVTARCDIARRFAVKALPRL
jgi:hypothetical protein